MSETLSGSGVRNLSQTPEDLEMGELRKITTLQDMSLAEGEDTLAESNEENERKLKTNSLRRFFRLPNKKKLEDEGSLEGEKSELEMEEALGRKNLSTSFSKGSLKSSLSSYWSSVFKPKKSGKSLKSNQEMDLKSNEASSMENGLPPTTLKDGQDNAGDSEDAIVLEEIQSLSISEERAGK